MLWARHHKLWTIHKNMTARLIYTNMPCSLSIRLAVKVCVYCAWMPEGECVLFVNCVRVHVLHSFLDTCVCWVHSCISKYVCIHVCVFEKEYECVCTIHMYVPTIHLMMSTSLWGSNFTSEMMWEFLFLHPVFSSRWGSILPSILVHNGIVRLS